MFSRFYRTNVIMMVLGMLVGCASTKDPAETFANQSAVQLFQHAEVAATKKNYQDAIKYYEALDALYPFSPYSQQALLNSIGAYYASRDYALTAATAARFIHAYPHNRQIDYAYYLKGVAEMLEDRSWGQRYLSLDVAKRDPGMLKQAYATFSALMTQFPKSTYAPYAQQRMIYLRNTFATHELYIAQHYLAKHAYVGAVNRASDIIHQYASTPAVIPALNVMVKGYQALGQTEQANRAQQLLDLNK